MAPQNHLSNLQNHPTTSKSSRMPRICFSSLSFRNPMPRKVFSSPSFCNPMPRKASYSHFFVIRCLGKCFVPHLFVIRCLGFAFVPYLFQIRGIGKCFVGIGLLFEVEGLDMSLFLFALFNYQCCKTLTVLLSYVPLKTFIYTISPNIYLIDFLFTIDK